MTIPKLKRIKIASVQDLLSWLGQNADHKDDVMVVTQTQASGGKHVGVEDVNAAVSAHGWISGRRYTLNTHLIGHVISKSH